MFAATIQRIVAIGRRHKRMVPLLLVALAALFAAATLCEWCIELPRRLRGKAARSVYTTALAVCIVFTLIPTQVFAAEGGSITFGTSSVADSGNPTITTRLDFTDENAPADCAVAFSHTHGDGAKCFAWADKTLTLDGMDMQCLTGATQAILLPGNSTIELKGKNIIEWGGGGKLTIAGDCGTTTTAAAVKLNNGNLTIENATIVTSGRNEINTFGSTAGKIDVLNSTVTAEPVALHGNAYTPAANILRATVMLTVKIMGSVTLTTWSAPGTGYIICGKADAAITNSTVDVDMTIPVNVYPYSYTGIAGTFMDISGSDISVALTATDGVIGNTNDKAETISMAAENGDLTISGSKIKVETINNGAGESTLNGGIVVYQDNDLSLTDSDPRFCRGRRHFDQSRNYAGRTEYRRRRSHVDYARQRHGDFAVLL